MPKPFRFASTNPVEFRWDIGTLIFISASNAEFNTTLLLLDILTSGSAIYISHFADMAIYSGDNDLDPMIICFSIKSVLGNGQR